MVPVSGQGASLFRRSCSNAPAVRRKLWCAGSCFPTWPFIEESKIRSHIDIVECSSLASERQGRFWGLSNFGGQNAKHSLPEFLWPRSEKRPCASVNWNKGAGGQVYSRTYLAFVDLKRRRQPKQHLHGFEHGVALVGKARGAEVWRVSKMCGGHAVA
jgi:hypothetical protein